MQNEKKYTAWLWFFTPLVVIAQLIALPKFFRQLQSLGKETNIVLPSYYGVLWVTIIIITTGISSYEMKYELPLWVTVTYVAFGALAMAWAQHWINTIKTNWKAHKLLKPKYFLRIFEWLALFPGLAIWGITIWTYLPQMFEGGVSLSKNSSFSLPKHQFSMPIKGDYWESRTPDQDSLGLIKGKFLDMQFDLYHYGFDESLDSVSYWRLQQIQNVLDKGATCHHVRQFANESNNVIAFGYCEGTYSLDPAVYTVTVINTEDKGVYELYGQFSSPKNSFNAYKQDILDMAEGFRPL